jgi:hypothetical protein
MNVDNPKDPTNGLIQQIHIAYKGNTTYPLWGTNDSNKYLVIANRLLNEWAHDNDHLWDSLWQNYSLDPITNLSMLNYDIPTGVIYLSDWVLMYLPVPPYQAGTFDRFQVIHPNRKSEQGSVAGTVGKVYLTGSTDGHLGNLTINFDQTSLQPQYMKATIQFGGYTMPSQLANPNDPVMIDIPEYLIYATASELARNDPSKQDQVPNLSGMAQNLYRKMITGNQGNSYQQPNNPYGTMQQNTGTPAPVYGAG